MRPVTPIYEVHLVALLDGRVATLLNAGVANRPVTVSGRSLMNVKSGRNKYQCGLVSLPLRGDKITSVYARESSRYPAPDQTAKTAAVSAKRNEKLSSRRLFLPSNI
jgi:hypothetical protein